MRTPVLSFLLLLTAALFAAAPATAQDGDLVINEFLADPNTSDGGIDLNGDGTSDSADEFVEIVNTGDAAIDISGYQIDDIADGGSSPYTFPDGTTLDAGEGAVILGSADDPSSLPIPAAFVDDGLPGLNNGGDDIRLLDADGNVVASITYGGDLAFEGVSAARNPNGEGGFQAQNTFGTMTAESAGENNNDGSPLGGDDGDGDPTTVQFAESGATVDEGAGTATIAVSISNPDGNEVSVDVAFDAGESSAEASDIGDYMTQTVTFPATASDGDTQNVTVPITDDEEDETDETANFDLTNLMTGGAATIGSPSMFDLTITDNDEDGEAGPSPNAWINELHYDNDGDDVGEFVEVVIERADTLDLSELSVVFYNGSDSETYGSELMLSEFTEGESEGDFTVYSIQEEGIQNGSPDGLALCYQGNPVESGGVTQFLSYEGTITAADGCAQGLTSTDIGVEEGTGTTAGQSLQLTGSGTDYADFSWTGPSDDSPGQVNDGQTLGEEDGADIAVTPESLGFGDVQVGQSETDTVTVSNEGDADLSVSDVSVSGDDGFSLADDAPTSFTLAPGEEQDLAVVFAPQSAGAQSGTLTIESDDADEGSVDVELSGNGVEEMVEEGDIAVSPESLDFGDVLLGESAEDSVVVSNEGNADLEISDLAIGGDNAEDFAIQNAPSLPATLAPEDSLTLVVAFTPSAAGSRAATLTIESDDADEGSVEVALSGNGVEEMDEDTTPPVCGAIAFERNDENQISAVVTSASDEESGIASVTFTRLRNLDGFAGGQGPFAEGETATFDADETTTVEIRGERQSFDQGGALVTLVENGAGLTQTCDPVLETISSERPTRFALRGNYPNPVRASTTIEFAIAEQAEVTLEVYDVLGRKVATLVDGKAMTPATYRVQWQANGLPSGTYVYRIEAGSFTASKQMVLVK